LATAIPETIAQEVVARLQQITTANGYNFNVSSVDRPPKNAKQWRPRHYGIVVDQKQATENEELSHPGNPPAMAFDLDFEITGFVLLSDEATASSDPQSSDMEAAIKKAIAEDLHWYNWDGNAVNSQWGESQFIEEPDYAGVIVQLTISYRVSETNPYAVRA
jgi:hypothetical protein